VTAQRETTEAVREAAWEIADILDCGPLSWAAFCCETEVSDSTLRRASRLLGLAGVICYDRVTDRWSRVGGIEIPAELLPRSALVLELNMRRATARQGSAQAADRFSVARAAMDALTGPERVEVIRHYMGSASKALRTRGVAGS
jgi:hypothetical protein